jgi:hypothetical protein
LLSLPLVATAQNPLLASAMIIGSGKLLAYTGLVKPTVLASGWGWPAPSLPTRRRSR